MKSLQNFVQPVSIKLILQQGAFITKNGQLQWLVDIAVLLARAEYLRMAGIEKITSLDIVWYMKKGVKMKKKVFISGPMSGYDNFNREAFMEAEKKLKEAGYSVFNPAWLLGLDSEWDNASVMAIDMAALSRCDAIYQLDGWRESMGAKAEYRTAEWLGLDIFSKGDLENNPKAVSNYKRYLVGEHVRHISRTEQLLL